MRSAPKIVSLLKSKRRKAVTCYGVNYTLYEARHKGATVVSPALHYDPVGVDLSSFSDCWNPDEDP